MTMRRPSRTRLRGSVELGELDIAVADTVDALGAAEIGGAGEVLGEIGIDQRLDLGFLRIGELLAVRAEELDAVILVGIVRGGDHDAEVAAHGARQHGDAGRRDRAGDEHVHADRHEAGHQRILDHIAREPRVLADDDAVAVVAVLEDDARGHADLHGEIGCDGKLIGPPADAVRAEVFPRHLVAVPPSQRLRSSHSAILAGLG